ncbi:MAG: lysoplasmalogenase [Chloroflexi bacterium]|nr:lysoplasmalogenase [Chloroflexota bacterium]
MFPALSTLQRFWFIALLLLWAGLLFGGFAFGKLDARRERRMPRWTRMASSATLVVAAWSWYLVSRGTTTALFGLLIAVGMTLGCLGDLFMARLLPVSQCVLCGMAAFGLGHVAYVAGGLIYGSSHGLAALTPLLAAWGVWLLVGVVGWFFVVFRGQKPIPLHWVALSYALLLASTAGVATGLALQQARLLPMALGAALFLTSDLILATHLFNGRRFYLVDDVIWLTYGPGQMLIVYAVGSVL